MLAWRFRGLLQRAGETVLRGAVARVTRIEVRGVTRLFGPVAALRGVDASFAGGGVTVLEGPNGAGKSTLLAVLATASRPSQGSISYEPMGTDTRGARREIGWVAHESHCYVELTARQNVELAARLHGVGPEAWRQAMVRVGAVALADCQVRTLSRGQRQRVALARALVHAPSVVLLDEPQTGLDSAGATMLERILGEEAERGAVVIVVSHGSGVADRLATARVRLEAGRVV